MGMIRRIAAVAAVACGAALLSACTPAPAPSPTPTAMTRTEAFTAAEATYRAYIDALNEVDLSDPATFEDVYRWETGDALASAKKSFSAMHADGWQVAGKTTATLIAPSTVMADQGKTTTLAVCVDVSRVALVDRNGTSVVAPDRKPVQPMQVTVSYRTADKAWLISQIDGRDSEPSCT